MDIIARKDALAQGLTHYFTGKPCKRGHIAFRYASDKSCSQCKKIHKKIFSKRNPSKSTEYRQRWRNKNLDKAKAYEEAYEARRFRLRTDAIRAKESLYRERARESRQAYIRQYEKHRKQNDPAFRLRKNMARRLNNSILKQFGKKATQTSQLIGCTVTELRQHLEVQFIDGMTWDNYGRHGWHVDHIRPCASFDLTDPEQQRQCFHYTNLQPLWAVDNIRKGAKWDGR